jgi:Universal stress protein family
MRPAPSAVLLVVAGGTVSRAAIVRTVKLAAGAPVTVVGVGQGSPEGRAVPPSGESPGGRLPGETEEVRRAVALAMTALENTGVMAYGHIAVTGSPARAIVRVARTRRARTVVLDQLGALAAELRRRLYGSGVTVLSVTRPASCRPPAWPA